MKLFVILYFSFVLLSTRWMLILRNDTPIRNSSLRNQFSEKHIKHLLSDSYNEGNRNRLKTLQKILGSNIWDIKLANGKSRIFLQQEMSYRSIFIEIVL